MRLILLYNLDLFLFVLEVFISLLVAAVGVELVEVVLVPLVDLG